MKHRAILLGATGANSLGRQFIPLLLDANITPVLVGRTAQQAAKDASLSGCEFIAADLCDDDCDETILQSLGDLSNISHIFIAGGGPHYKGAFVEEPDAITKAIWGSVLHGPMRLVQAFHRLTQHAYHIVTIASTSALRVRLFEMTYATAQAARARFAENFDGELCLRPGAKSTIFYPGGMRTGLWSQTQKTTGYMDPKEVAQIMWKHITREDTSTIAWRVLIDRAKDGSGTPIVKVL